MNNIRNYRPEKAMAAAELFVIRSDETGKVIGQQPVQRGCSRYAGMINSGTPVDHLRGCH
jgi:hypothetical protein